MTFGEMDYKAEHEKTLRLIRFFLPRLNRRQLAAEIEEEKRRREAEYQRQSAMLVEQAEREELGRLRGKKSKQMGLSLLGLFLGLAGVAIAIAADEPLGWILAALGGIPSIYYLIQGMTISGRIAKAEAELKSRLAQLNRNLRSALSGLDARLEELIRLYHASIASEDEVVQFTAERLEELKGLVHPALGFAPEDVLDERSAEVWEPTFMQIQDVPRPVAQDIEQSQEDIADWCDDIIEAMHPALKDPIQWMAFRARIFLMLGFSEACKDEDRLNALNAIRFSRNRRTYLAGHYFFQKILVTEGSVGLFRGYVNVLSRRVAYTFALHILHQDVSAIGIETSLSREKYQASGMTIDQHTRTLMLELKSGTTYRMSGDAGSYAYLDASQDQQIQEVASQANEAFSAQIENVRALILESKLSTPPAPSAPAF